MTASNAFGRQSVVPLTNKSGSSVAAGDVVYLSDGTNADSFTTGTTSARTAGVGIALDTIANNATGRVLVAGYAPLVNVNASVTLGHFGQTYTVAKQATDAGASRAAGTFCVFLTGGTTPDAIIWQPDLGGAGLTNPMTTTGDIIYSSDDSGTPARLAVGAAANSLLITSGGIPAWSGTVPRCGVMAYRNGATQNVNNTTAQLNLDAEVFDTDTFHDNVTNNTRLTIPSGKSGLYLCFGGTFQSGSGLSSIGVIKNGAAVIGAGRDKGAGAAAYNSFATVLALVATDYIELSATTTTNINLGHATVVDAFTYFGAILLQL